MSQKTILGAVIVVALVAVFFAAWKLNTQKMSGISEEQTTSTDKKAALSQLQDDLQTVTPHFIDATDPNSQTYTSAEQKIKDDVVALFLAINPGGDKGYYSNLLLRATGKRYILISQPSSGSANDEIVDSQTGKVIPISAETSYYLTSEGRGAALYINTQAIYTYSLDQGSARIVSGSQLSGNETYNSGTSDFRMVPEQTHTKNSITISVFDSSQLVQNPEAKSQPTAMQTMNKKVRSITLPF